MSQNVSEVLPLVSARVQRGRPSYILVVRSGLSPNCAAEFEFYKIYRLLVFLRFFHFDSNFCTAPSSKIQLNFAKHFRIFAVSFSKCCTLIANFVQNSQMLMKISRNFSIFNEKLSNLLYSQISGDFARHITEHFTKQFSKS